MIAEPHTDRSLSDGLSSLALKSAPSERQGLCHLPAELLDTIVASLDRLSLCALALTCTATNTCASRGLYATYTNLGPPTKAPFQLFLRTLCERPDLAALVKSLKIRGWQSEFEVAAGVAWQGATESREDEIRKRTGPTFVSVSKSAGAPPGTLKLFEKTARKIGLTSQDLDTPLPPLKKVAIKGEALREDADFIRLLRHGVEDAQVVLMLALLPSLTKMSIRGISTYSSLDWHQFLRRPSTALRALQEVDIVGALSQHHGSYHTTTLSFLELTPNLRHLHLSALYVVDARKIYSLVSGKKLQCFYASNVQIDLQTLRSLLSGNKLEAFYYMPGLGGLTETVASKLAEDSIVDCLKESRDSIQQFTLYSPKSSQTPVLSQFEALHTIEMPYSGFCDKFNEIDTQAIAKTFRKRIPRSLSRLLLRFIDPSYNVKVCMEVLVNLKLRGKFPELETVKLTFVRFDRLVPFFAMAQAAFMQDLEDSLGEMFKEAGLRLELELCD